MTLLEPVVTALRAGGVPFAVIGAAALSAHGIGRSSLDIDLLVTDPRVLDPGFWSSLREKGLAVDVRRGGRDDPLAGVVRVGDAAQPVDVVVGRQAWQRDAIARAAPLRLGSLDVPVVAVADLILLKLYAGGTQDQTDIRLLLATPPGMDARETVDTAVAALPRDARALWRRLRG